MARERLDRHTMRLLRDIGLPEISTEQIEALAARLREAYAAEQAALQIGADPSRNTGGTEAFDAMEDGAPPIMLEVVRCENQ